MNFKNDVASSYRIYCRNLSFQQEFILFVKIPHSFLLFPARNLTFFFFFFRLVRPALTSDLLSQHLLLGNLHRMFCFQQSVPKEWMKAWVDQCLTVTPACRALSPDYEAQGTTAALASVMIRDQADFLRWSICFEHQKTCFPFLQMLVSMMVQLWVLSWNEWKRTCD